MGIIYYPDRIFKGRIPSMDRFMTEKRPKIVSGTQSVDSTKLDKIVYADTDWTINSIALNFSDTTSRAYRFKVHNGRSIVQNMNDYLWFHVSGTMPQRIILSPSFYTGTELATHLKAQMDANAAYVAAGITFTIAYDSATGIFTITPSSGTIKYVDINTAQTMRYRQSIAGHLFGFTTTSSAFASSVQSNAPVAGLDQETLIFENATSVVLDHYHDDQHPLSMDQALRLEVDVTGGLSVTYAVVYEENV